MIPLDAGFLFRDLPLLSLYSKSIFPVILLILGGTAVVDAFRGRVPGLPLFVGGLFALWISQTHEGWAGAAWRMGQSVGAMALLWGLNELYYRLAGRDGFGMGDTKWTGLAVFGFGLGAVFWSWCLAAWLGLVWMGGRKVWLKATKGYDPSGGVIHFAPFLFVALGLVLWLKGITF